MSDFFQTFVAYVSDIFGTILSFRLRDIIDVAAVAFVLYHALKLVRETRAMQFIKSIAVIFVVYFLANEFNLISLKFLMKNVLDIGLVALVVLFQPELRRALEQLGRSKITELNVFGGGQTHDEALIVLRQELIEIIAESCADLSSKKTGALIVIERQIKLGEVINSGTIIDSKPSVELVENIFFINSPLHDGALVIRGGRLYAAGCFLPLSANMEIGRELGTRHRAALGMSEVSDAVIVIVSEETGALSVALDSSLQRGLSLQNLKKLLSIKLNATTPEDGQEGKKHVFWKVKK
jgi:diadenylate cyclase